jgi:hypothetical protein
MKGSKAQGRQAVGPQPFGIPLAIALTAGLSLSLGCGAGEHLDLGNAALSSGPVRFVGLFCAGPPNPGGVRQLFRFEAKAAGHAELAIPHEGGFAGRPATPPFSLTIEVS